MLAKVRPLLFWISRDDVGGARVSWRGDRDGAVGFDLLIGSDPERAPRRVNKWGFIAEEVRGSDARVRRRDEAVERTVDSRTPRSSSQATRKGGYVFRAIQGVANDREASANVRSIRVARDLTYRDVEPLLQKAAAITWRRNPIDRAPGSHAPRVPRRTRRAREQQRRIVPATARRAASTIPNLGLLRLLRDLLRHDACARRSCCARRTIGGQHYANVARSDFEVRNRTTGEITRFQLTYHTTGALAGVPVHAIYQPRWWFEVQLFLDDQARF